MSIALHNEVRELRKRIEEQRATVDLLTAQLGELLARLLALESQQKQRRRQEA